MGEATRFEAEIREQPEVLARQLVQTRPAVEALAEEIRRADVRYVVIAARGSSDNAARYGQYLLGLGTPGLTVALAAPSLLTLYGSRPSFRDALVIGISQSGQTPDVVEVLQEARCQGAMTVAITNEPASPLASAALRLIPLHSGVERAVAASKTYTSSLYALAMLRAALVNESLLWDELATIPDLVARALERAGDMSSEASRFHGRRRFVVVARGLSYATACELALKLGETSHVLAQPFSAADFRHGPIAMVDPDLPVVLIGPNDRASDDVAALAGELAHRGANIVAISNREDVLAHAGVSIALPDAIPEWLTPIVSIVPGQLWALALALQAGLDPDRPRGLQKVTRTR